MQGLCFTHLDLAAQILYAINVSSLFLRLGVEPMKLVAHEYVMCNRDHQTYVSVGHKNAVKVHCTDSFSADRNLLSVIVTRMLQVIRAPTLL